MGRLSSCKKFFHINRKLLPIKLHFIFYMLAISTMAYGSIIAKSIGITATAIGIVDTISPFISVLVTPFFGWLTDRLGKVKLILIVTILIQVPMDSIVPFLPPISNVTYHFTGELSCHSNDLFVLPHTPNQSNSDSNNQNVKCQLICADCLNLEVSEDITYCGKNFSLEVQMLRNHTFHSAKVITVSMNGSEFPSSCEEGLKQDCEANCISTRKNNIYKSYQFWTLLVTKIINSLIGSATTSLGDAACYEALQEKPLEFGKQRAWISIAWGTGTMTMGYLLDLMNPNKGEKIDYSYSVYVMWFWILIDIAVLSQAKLKQAAKSENIVKDVSKIFRKLHPNFLAGSVLIIGILTGIQWSYMFWYLEDLGASSFLMGLSMGVICLAVETPFMFIAGWVIKKIGRDNTVALAFLSLAVWFLSMSFINNPWWILPIQLTQGPSFGLFYVATTSYGKVVTAPGTEATMQTILGALYYALGGAGGSMLGGLGFDNYGGRNTYRFSAYVALGGAAIYKILTVFVAGENTAIYKGDTEAKHSETKNNDKKESPEEPSHA